MNVAIFVETFPVLSETFILNQIVGLIELGHEVHIHARGPGEATGDVHENISHYRILNHVHYDEPIPFSKLKRISTAVIRTAHWGWRAPTTTLDSMNVFRYGRSAISLRLHHETLPAHKKRLVYDVVHCHFGPNGSRAVRLRKFGALRGPVITTFHGYDANKLPRVHGPKIYDELFAHGDAFTVGSEFMHKRLINLGAPKSKLVRLPMGVDLAFFHPAKKQGSADQVLRLLSVARLVEVKGIAYALLAVRTLLDRGVSLTYRVAGDGPLRRQLEASAQQLGLNSNVQFVGALTQSQIIDLYSDADIFILPSVVTASGEEESQSVALAEAQACKLPVVATTIGGNAETVLAGETGLLVPPRDPDALASAILWLSEHPDARLTMGEHGRVHVKEHYDLGKLNRQLVALYDTVAESYRNKGCKERIDVAHA